MMAKGTLLAGLLVMGLALTAWAQGPGNRNYNPSTETTVKGTVEAVDQATGRRGFNGTHLELKTADGVYSVHLGPSSYIANQGFSFAKNDEIEVTGSKVTMNGKDTILAREVKKGGKTLTLRNVQGIPAWSGGPGR